MSQEQNNSGPGVFPRPLLKTKSAMITGLPLEGKGDRR